MAEQTLDSPDISQRDYRALREGKTLPSNSSDAPKADAAAPAASAPDAAETDAGPDTAEHKTETPPPDKSTETPKPKRGLVDEVVELRKRTRELEARLASAGPKPDSTPVETKPDADDLEPQADKFSDYIEWQKAWTRWDRRQDQKMQAREAETKQRAQAEHAKAQTWNERVEAAKVSKADYELVALNPDLPVSRVMGDAITDSEIGSEILYHLGRHPAEAARIAKLSPVAQVREIGKLEFQLAKPLVSDEDEESPATIAVSKAPAPVPRPGGGAPRPNPARNIEGMTQAEYRSYRESGKIR